MFAKSASHLNYFYISLFSVVEAFEMTDLATKFFLWTTVKLQTEVVDFMFTIKYT